MIFGQKKKKRTVHVFDSGEDVLGVLRDLVTGARERSLTEFREALAQFVPKTDEDVDLLLEVLRHKEWRYADEAAAVLTRSKVRVEEIKKTLVKAGKSPNFDDYAFNNFLGRGPLGIRGPLEAKRTPEQWEKYGDEILVGLKRHLGLHEWTTDPPNPTSAAECFAIAFRDDYPRARDKALRYFALLRDKYRREVVATLRKREHLSNKEIREIYEGSISFCSRIDLDR